MSLLLRSTDGNNKPVNGYCRAASMVNQNHCTLVYSWCRCGSPERGTREGTILIFFPTVQDVFGCWKKSYGNGISVTEAGLRSWQLLALILHIGGLFQVTVCWQSNSRLGQLFKCLGSPVQGVHCLPQSGESPIKCGVKKASSTFYLVGMLWSMGLQKQWKKKKMKQIKFTVVLWNVWTLITGDNHLKRRTALIAKELARHSVDVAALQETTLEGQGQLKESMHMFFWIGKPAQCREASVAFAISNTIVSKLPKLPHGISERLMHLTIPLAKDRYLSMINVYAPTMTYANEAKEAFHQVLASVVDPINVAGKLLILGNFNAWARKDHTTYSDVIGKFGKGNKNSNGELLLNICTQRHLCITNTYFSQPDKNYFMWMHPRSRHYHLLEYMVAHKVDLADILSTKAMWGAECSADHYLVRSCLRMKVALPRCKTPSTVPRKLDVAKLDTSEYQQTLVQAMDETFRTNSSTMSDDIEEMWNDFKTIMYTKAANVLGHPKCKNTDWFQEHDEEIQSLLAKKQKAHMQYLASDSQQNKMAFHLVRAKAQKRIRKMKDDWWNSKSQELQRLADFHDYQGLFAALRAINGPCSNAVAPVKSADGSVLLTNMKDITGCWKEQFPNLLNQQGTADERATSQMCVCTPKDDLCIPIMMEELKKALQATRRGKAPGLDGISPEILKLGGP